MCQTQQHKDSQRAVFLANQAEIKLILSSLLYDADVIVLSARVTVQSGSTGNVFPGNGI